MNPTEEDSDTLHKPAADITNFSSQETHDRPALSNRGKRT
jgi:hypothetical protein